MPDEIYLIRTSSEHLAQAPVWWPWLLSLVLAGGGVLLWAFGRPLVHGALVGSITLGVAFGAWCVAVVADPERSAVLFLVVGAALGGVASALFARAMLMMATGLLLAFLTLGWVWVLFPGSGPDLMQGLEQGRREFQASVSRVPYSRLEEARKGQGEGVPQRPLTHSLVASIKATGSGFWNTWQGRSGMGTLVFILAPLAAMGAGLLLARSKTEWITAPVTSLMGAGMILAVLWVWGLGRPKLFLWVAAWTFLGTLGLAVQVKMVGWRDARWAPNTEVEEIKNPVA